MPTRSKALEDPFGRFDDSQDVKALGDPFGQFDAEPAAPEPVAAPPPEEPSVWEKAKGYAGQLGDALSMDARVAGSGIANLNAGLYGAGQALVDVAGAVAPGEQGALSKWLGERRAESLAASEHVLPKAEIAAQPRIARAAISGIQSFAQQLPGLAASALSANPAPALALMTASTGGDSYARAKEAGLPLAQALSYGVSDAGIEYLTEVGPMGALVKTMNEIPGFWKAAIEFGKKELAGEEIATLLQDFNEYANLHPEQTINDYLKERPGAAADTLVATLVGIGAQTGLFRSIHAAINREPKEPEEKPSLLDEIAKAQEEPSTGRAETAELEGVQNKARAAAAAQGGDNLDQEVAASVAALDHTAKARQSSEAAFDYVEQMRKAQAEQAKSAAFDQAEETAAVQKQTQEGILERQGQAQFAIDAAKGAPETAAPAMLADVWPAQPTAAAAPAAPKTLAERRAAVEAPKIEAPLALPAPKSGPTITTREFRTGKKGQRLKGTVPTTKEGGGTVVVSPAGEAQVLSENTPTVPGTTTGYGTLAIRRQAVKEERPRTPVVETTRQQVEQAAAETAASPQNDLTPPTPAQHMAENFKSAPLKIHGLDVTLQYPKDSERPIINAQGEQVGTRKMPGHYGYVKGTVDADGQQVDVLIGDQPEAQTAFVVDQLKPEGGFEQHKVLLGYPNQMAATRALKKMYPERPVGPITQMTPDELKTWLKEGDTTKPLKPAEVKATEAQRAQKTEPKERPIQQPKPGKVSVQAPAPVVEAASARSTTEKPGVARGLEALLEKAARRTLMELHGQDILDAMEENNESPIGVSTTFWKDTYWKLGSQAQQQFQKMVKNLTGFEPGATIAISRDGSRELARDWQDVAAEADLPDNVAHLEGTQRGYVALMKWANDQAGGPLSAAAAAGASDATPAAAPAEAAVKTLAERRAKEERREAKKAARAAKREVREKTEPKERPIAKPKPGKVSKQEPAPAPAPKATKQQGPTLAERKAQSAAAKAKNETAKAVAEAKAAVEQKAAEKPAGPKLRYAEGTLITLRPRWKRTTTAKGLSRWDYGNRGSVEEFINEAGESRFTAARTDAAAQGGMGRSKLTFMDPESAKDFVERGAVFADARLAIRNKAKAAGVELDTSENPATTEGLEFDELTINPAANALLEKRLAEGKKADAEFIRSVIDAASQPEPPHVSLVDAQAAVQSLTKALGPSYQVLARPEDAPPHIFEKMAEDDKLDAPGVYDVDNDVAYTFAENNATVEDVKRNAAHEAVAHLGWRRLGNAAEHAETMEDIFQMAEDKAWMQNFASQHGLDESSIADRNLIADEYVAHVAESGTDLPVFKKMVAYARSVLRKHFPDVKWTEDDIRYMLHRAKTKILKGSGHAWHHPKQTGVRYASQPTPENAVAPGPEGMAIRQDMTLEQLSQYSPSIIRSRIDAVKDFAAGQIDNALALVHLNNLPDFVAPGKMNSAGKYALEVDSTEGDFSAEIAKYAPTAKAAGEFYRKNQKVAEKLAEVMHAATIARADPAQPYSPIHSGQRIVTDPKTGAKTTKPRALSEEQQKENQAHERAWRVLKRAFDALPQDAKDLYVRIRDDYAQMNKDVWAALETRINETAADSEHKHALLTHLRKEFEQGRIEPYFSLFRKGKYWAVAKDRETGAVEYFVRSDSSAEIEAFRAQMRAAGYATPTGEKITTDKQIIDSVDPGFVAKTMELVNEFDNPELADEIWQLYLKRLPEMSARKRYIHRKGRLGFTKDFVQAYSYHMFHGAHQLARMRHIYKLETHLQNAKKELDILNENGDPERKWASPLLRELQRRHEWVLNPETAGWANLMATGGFVWYLANSPAAAAVNMSQTLITTLPNLASRFGFGTAAREIGHAMRLWGSARGPLVNRTRGWERAVMDEAMRTNLFQSTNMHTMVSIGEEGALYGGRFEKSVENFAYLFHKAEQFNREVTYLAAARAYGNKHPQGAGESMEAFVARTAAYARKAVFDTQGNYANANRPRLLQGNAAKVFGLFRQYAFFMSYRMLRDFDTSITRTKKRYANETVEQFKERRSVARKQFLGTLGQVALLTGVRGMPLYWAAQLIANALWGDDDDPYDIDAAMQKNLEDWGGEKVASVIMEGPVATAVGGKLSNRIGMNNMIFQEVPSNKYGADLAAFYATQLGGPYLSTTYNLFDWAYPQVEGYEDRAFERVIPKWARDPIRAVRFATEGVTTKTGDEIIPKDKLTAWDIAIQGLGFSPLKVARQQDINRAVMGEALKLQRREQNLRNKYAVASRADDAKAMGEVMADMNRFVAKHPESTLLSELGSSLSSRARREAMSVNGVYLDPRLFWLYDKYGSKPPEPAK